MNVVEKYGLTKYDSASKEITPQLISDIIEGKYGNGNSRIVALATAGYNAVDVQAKVNELYKIYKELEPIKKKAGEYWECVLKF